MVVREGEAHELPEGGWVEVEALHCAQAVAVVGQRASFWQWLAARLGRWVQRPVLGC